MLMYSAAIACLSMPVLAAVPTPDELAQCTSWVRNNLRPPKSTAGAGQCIEKKSGMTVVENHGPILKNGRPDGRPLKLGNIEFTHGLICHAMSCVNVVLPGPAKSFTSTIGVDANAGGGSVIFRVCIDGKDVFKSEVMRGSEPGVPVSVDLGGVSEFTIKASDAGDGIACDHADWADAKVTLMDGREIWLSDMPVIEPVLAPRGSATPPFSFVYGGRCSDDLIGDWKYTEATKKLDKNRTRTTRKYLDPETRLEVRVEMVQYKDYPTVEWTVYFRNTGEHDTPVLENLHSLDTVLTRAKDGEFVLHHAIGSPMEETDFKPLVDVLKPNAEERITAGGGRPTDSDLCFFNVEMPGKQGLIIGLGWPGQWASDFVRDAGSGLRIVAGQELTHFRLHPGEEVRTPLVVLQFWQGEDWVRAQNIWRRWMIAHNMPHPGGKNMQAQFGGCGGNPLPNAAEEIGLIEGFLKDGVKLDHWIIDAGWYVNRNSWTDTGTWEVDGKRFPNGLKEVADCIHKSGGQFIVWFEPERVNAGTWLAENRPEWVLGGKSGGLLNLGNPEARKWITERIDSILVNEGIDNYRSDYNISPLGFWRGNDADDRQGITENLYVQGFLAFWDELLRRHPKMYIDTCASGGRRNDLETLRRSVPLLRSDWAVLHFDKPGVIGQQCQTYGISYWIPFHGTGAPNGDLYLMRSAYCPAYRLGYTPTDPKRDVKTFRQAVGEIRQIDPYLLGDYYPLTPYSVDSDVWIAWQYDSPEKGGGVVQAFRRDESAVASMNLKLRGLDPAADYQVTNLDGNVVRKMSGRSLLYEGLQVTIPNACGSAVITYKRAE
jgi:alpha-galactosidase